MEPNTDNQKITKLIQASRKNYAIEYKKPIVQEEKVTVKKDSTVAKSNDKKKQEPKTTSVFPENKKRT
ncbi:MAG: hypothetical protein ACREHC_04525 [Candidatus Levyibacteriota bacterium]